MYGFAPVFYMAYANALCECFVCFILCLMFVFFLASSSLARPNSVLEDEFASWGYCVFCSVYKFIWYLDVCSKMGRIYGHCVLGFLLSQDVHYI